VTGAAPDEPAVRRVYENFFTGGLALAAMMEDLPYLHNRVLISVASSRVVYESELIAVTDVS
jgi:hypothetical protein